MVWACGENGRVPYGKKGVYGGCGGWVLGGPMLGRMDGVKVAFGSRDMTVDAARQCAKDGKEGRALLHTKMIKFNTALFGVRGPCVLSYRPPLL